MAILKQLNTGQRSILRAQHTIGRDPAHSHTCIHDGDISRQHSQLYWQPPHWLLRDTSKNGVWLNHQRIQPLETPRLSVGDQLRFGLQQHNVWHVLNLEAPTSCLIPVDDTQEPIWLCQYTTREKHVPHLDYEPIDNQRCFLKLDHEYREYHQGQCIHYLNHDWQLLLAPLEPKSTTLLTEVVSLDSIQWRFNCSLDEEHIHLKGNMRNGKTLNLNERVHHYLLLVLARQRQQDAAKGFDHASQGWVDMQNLCTMLGLTETHINIQIFRARKQLQNLIVQVSEPIDFVERRHGEIRFSCSQFEIYRGTALETSMAHNEQNHVELTGDVYSL